MSRPNHDRWTPERTRAALDALHGRVDLRWASFGEVDGRSDLRDLPLTGFTETPVAQSETSTLTDIGGYADFEGAHWDSFDLSGASNAQHPAHRLHA